MKLLSTIMLGCLPVALAKSIVVTFPKDTPDSVVKDARQAIIDANGEITHDYQLIKCVYTHPFLVSFSHPRGFAATAPDEAIQQLSTESSGYHPTIEDDTIVSTQ
ncbi:uncharacterized protein KD926_006763 [Aspergillus affinis]|uniref:uncharacterized protein n=1 Tax=Aspergillus affinis TaxID=1070780 RepID=UPI0022FEF109|nr:uncharacterized protein KD926_006763 [Aspergillus affinis]KAI9041525.1 hypothetical protein KD926_006763 [Aspergillus affinis]